MVNVLVVGSGGREHAISWKISQSKNADNVFTAPGNGGTQNNIPIQVDQIDDLADFQANVEINNTFLRLIRQTPIIKRADGTSVYRVDTVRQADGSFSISLRIDLKPFTNTQFNTYSVANTSYVRSFVKVSGVNSGISKIIEVQISNCE